ncbi:MAG: hypothetical protein IT324_24625 [Anaerolineae bacterium]|nr:hypothetical protein [Anaerolineae bacterium]
MLTKRHPYAVMLVIVLMLLIPTGLAQPAGSIMAQSPNAAWVVFVGNRPPNLYSVNLADGKLISLLPADLEGEPQVNDYAISPDGNSVVYHMSDGNETYINLVPTGGRTPKTLTKPGFVAHLRMSLDSKFIVYFTGTSEQRSIVSLPITGGESVQLSAKGTVADEQKGYVFTADGKTVVYVAQNPRNNTVGLYAAPVAGGTPVQIGQPLEEIQAYALVPDGSAVVYYAKPRNGKFGIFSAPVVGGEPTVLSDMHDIRLNKGSDGDHFRISPDGKMVLFMGDMNGKRTQLFSVPMSGAQPTALATFVDDNRYQISADGRYVLYVSSYTYKEKDKDGKESTKTGMALYSLTLDGGQPITLVPLFTSEFGFTISPDGKSVVYAQKLKDDPAVKLFSIPIAGGTPVQLSPDKTTLSKNTSFETVRKQFAISADSKTVVFFAEDENGLQLYSVPLAGGKPVLLNDVPGSIGQAYMGYEFYIVKNANWVVYVLDQENIGASDLYAVPITGGKPTRLTQESVYEKINLKIAGN